MASAVPALALSALPAPSSVHNEDRAVGAALIDLLTERVGTTQRIVELALEFGLVDERRLALRTARLAGLTFRGIRGLVLDRRLLNYVPLRMCHQLQVAPLALSGDTLQIAVVDPAVPLADIVRTFPNLELRLVVVTRSELRLVLDRTGIAAP